MDIRDTYEQACRDIEETINGVARGDGYDGARIHDMLERFLGGARDLANRIHRTIRVPEGFHPPLEGLPLRAIAAELYSKIIDRIGSINSRLEGTGWNFWMYGEEFDEDIMKDIIDELACVYLLLEVTTVVANDMLLRLPHSTQARILYPGRDPEFPSTVRPVFEEQHVEAERYLARVRSELAELPYDYSIKYRTTLEARIRCATFHLEVARDEPARLDAMMEPDGEGADGD